MKWSPVDLPDGSYADPAKPFSAQDVVNYLPEYASGPARSRLKLVGVPGLKPWADVGDGPCRALYACEDKRFAVIDDKLLEFDADGVATQRGIVPGRKRVVMSHNQIAAGYQVAIATGSAGYIYNTVSREFVQITDDSFPGGKCVDFIDQMLVWVEPQGRYFLPSDIADGLSYTQLETQEAEAAPDKIQRAIVAFQKLIVLGKRTTQFYTSTGNPDELFADDKAGNNTGCASPHCPVLLDNTLFMVDDKGRGVRLNGSSWERITTHAIEYEWSQCDLSKCYSYVWEDRGHAVWYVTFPTRGGMTWGYDCATRKWHRRATAGMDRWQVSHLVRWGEDWYAGIYNSGVVYKLDWDYPLEGCEVLWGEFSTPVVHDNGNRVFLNGLRVEFDTGAETVTCSEAVPQTPDNPDGVGDPLFLSVGANTYTSPTGQTWTALTLPTTGNYCYANSTTVVYTRTSSGAWYYSTDRGQTWNLSTSVYTGCVGITYGSGRFMAMRSSGGVLSVIYSADGVTWTPGGTVATTTGNGIAYGNGAFVIAASGGLYSSTDNGITWTRTSTGDWTAIGFNGTGFLAGTNTGGQFFYSTSGTSWTTAGGSMAFSPLAITGGTGYFVVGTFTGGIYRTTNNGASLTQIIAGASRYYSVAKYGSRILFGSGGGGSNSQLWSDDAGLTWNVVSPAIADNDICVIPP